MGKFSQNMMAGIVYDDLALVLGALATKTAVQGASKIDASRAQGFRLLKTQYWVEVIGKTNDQGGIIVGLSHNLSVTEIKECIEADPQGSKAIHRPESEASSRPIWPLVLIPSTVTSIEDKLVAMGELKPGWSAPEGSTFNWFAFNLSTGTLTTGTQVKIFAKHYGVWLKD